MQGRSSDWTPRWAGQQRPGPTTPDPEPQANPFSPFFPAVHHFAVLCHFATTVRVALTRRITRRTTFVLHSLFIPFCTFLRYGFTEYPYIRAIMHSHPVSPQTLRAFDLSGFRSSAHAL